MNLRTALLRIASENPSMRIHLLPLLSKVAAEDKWISFLKAKYEGGKKKVPNPNPKTQKQHPEVSVSTALKDEGFYKKIREEFESWSTEKTDTKSTSEKEWRPSTQDEQRKLRDHYALFSKLPKEHRDALTKYTGSGYKDLNKYLRRGPPPSLEAVNHNGFLTKMEEVFASKLARTPQDLLARRGVDSYNHPLSQLLDQKILKVGDMIEDSGYLSTTLNRAVPHDIEILIRVPKGSKGLFLPDISQYPEERELLLDKGSKLRVVSIDGRKVTTELVS